MTKIPGENRLWISGRCDVPYREEDEMMLAMTRSVQKVDAVT